MIDPRSRSLEWIQQAKQNIPGILDTPLVEKAIRALSLLESLVRSGCPFIFKGGTALMLHLDTSRRLSIDVDIVCPPGTDIRQYLGKFGQEYGFTSRRIHMTSWHKKGMPAPGIPMGRTVDGQEDGAKCTRHRSKSCCKYMQFPSPIQILNDLYEILSQRRRE